MHLQLWEQHLQQLQQPTLLNKEQEISGLEYKSNKQMLSPSYYGTIHKVV